MLFTFLRRPARRPRRSFVPRLTALEDRTVPSTFTVTNLLDNPNPGSLRWAVGQANAHPGPDTVNFSPGLHGAITLGSELKITGDVTIDGPGADRITVSGANATRVFDVTVGGTNVTIDNLTVANGKATGDTLATPFGFPVTLGGGVLNNGGNLALDRVTFTNNQAVGTGAEAAAGGAVANVQGGHLTATRSAFGGNVANGSAGAFGGAVTNDAGSTAAFTLDTFTNNQALGAGAFGGAGGALTAYGGSTVTVALSTFAGNLAQGSGGLAGGSSGAIDCSSVGTLRLAPASLTVSGALFTGNQAVGVGADPNGNEQGNGGAVGVEGFNSDATGAQSATAVVTGSSFLGNRARGADGGGALSFGGAIVSFSGDLTVGGCFFQNNEAHGGAGGGGDGIGGAIGASNLANAGSLTSTFLAPTTAVSFSTFLGNRATGGTDGGARGGAIANLRGSLDLSASVLLQDSATAGAGVLGPGGVARGGGLANDRGGTATVTQTAILFCTATGGAGAAGSAGGDALGGAIFNGRTNTLITPNTDATLTLSSSLLLGNQAHGGAGGAGANGGNGFGGGLFNGLGAAAGTPTATVSDTTITLNQAVGGAAGSGGTAGQGVGGGIYNTGTVLVRRVAVAGNTASTSNNDVFGPLTPF